jgi:hypothetical protein
MQSPTPTPLLISGPAPIQRVSLPSDLDPQAVMAEGARRREERRMLAARELAEARAFYSNEARGPVLRPSFAVYLDGLGTRASILDLTDDH